MFGRKFSWEKAADRQVTGWTSVGNGGIVWWLLRGRKTPIGDFSSRMWHETGIGPLRCKTISLLFQEVTVRSSTQKGGHITFSGKIQKTSMQGLENWNICSTKLRFLQKDMQVDKIRFPESSAIGIKPISKLRGSERLIRAAIDYALTKGHKAVSLLVQDISRNLQGG